jgi:hypothetical protein
MDHISTQKKAAMFDDLMKDFALLYEKAESLIIKREDLAALKNKWYPHPWRQFFFVVELEDGEVTHIRARARDVEHAEDGVELFITTIISEENLSYDEGFFKKENFPEHFRCALLYYQRFIRTNVVDPDEYLEIDKNGKMKDGKIKKFKLVA